MHKIELLINRALDGELSEVEAQALECWIRESEDNQRTYVLRVFEHTQIKERVIDHEYQRVLASSMPSLEESGNILEELLAIEQRSADPTLVDVTDKLEEEKQQQRLALQHKKRITQKPALAREKRVVVIPRWLVMAGSIAAAISILVGLSLFFNFGNQDAPTAADQPSPPRNTKTIQAYLIDSRNAQWASAEPGFELRTGQLLHLESGQATLRFASSAQMTLYPGASVEIQGENGCRLTKGNLTAKVPSKASGFQVLVPGGLITDLGTAFSVELSDQGHSTIQVEQGSVTIQTQSPNGERTETLLLTAGMEGKIDPEQLVASLITREPLDLASTGFGIAPGEADPNWLISAISTDPDYEAKPAIVAAPHGPNDKPIQGWQPSDIHSQWLLISGQGFDVPDEQRTTIQYRLELPQDALLDELALVLQLWVDNKIEQVRINNHDLYEPDAPSLQAFSYGRSRPLVLNRHFTAGQNIIEIVFVNGTGNPKPFNPSAFRARWSESFIKRLEQVQLH